MNETHRSANAILSRRGALRQLAAGAGLALAAALPSTAAVAAPAAAPAPVVPAIDPRLQEAFAKILTAWEHIPEDRRDVVAHGSAATAIIGAEVYGGWTAPKGWLASRGG